MADLKSTVPVIPREVLEQRIEAARGRIFRAGAIVDCARAALPSDVQAGEPDVIHALDEVRDILGGAAARLEVLLEEPPSRDELEALGFDAEPPAIPMPSSAEMQ